MTARILKFWHQWSWAYHILVTTVMVTVFVMKFGNAEADVANRVDTIERQRASENIATRMAVQENTSAEINRRLGKIDDVQGKIFDRINQIADRSNGH